jgi:hypothetical protein
VNVFPVPFLLLPRVARHFISVVSLNKEKKNTVCSNGEVRRDARDGCGWEE